MFSQVAKQAKQMQAQLEQMQKDLEALEITGVSGGKSVQVVMSGSGDVKKIVIDPNFLTPEDKEVVEDLLVAAFRDGREKVKNKMDEMTKSITGGMPIPGMGGL